MSCNAAHIDCRRAVNSDSKILFILPVLPPAGMTEWLHSSNLYNNDLPAVLHIFFNIDSFPFHLPVHILAQL